MDVHSDPLNRNSSHEVLPRCIEIINEQYEGPPILASDIDTSKDRLKEFEKAIYTMVGSRGIW